MAAPNVELIVDLRHKMATLRLSHDRYMRNADAFKRQIDRGIAIADKHLAVNSETLQRLTWLLE